MRLESRRIDSLWIHPKHRLVDPHVAAKMAEAINKSGIVTPIIVTEDGEILDGLVRWWAIHYLTENTYILCIVEDDPNASEKYFQMRRL